MTIAVKLLLTVALIFSIAVPFGAFAAGEKTKGRYKTALAANTVMVFGTMLFAVCVLFGGTAFAAESTAAAGGISTGMPLTLRVGIKPTPSIGRPQKTVSLARMENTELTIRGRHDPCIAHRAVPVVEAVTACVLLDLLLEEHHGTF